MRHHRLIQEAWRCVRGVDIAPCWIPSYARFAAKSLGRICVSRTPDAGNQMTGNSAVRWGDSMREGACKGEAGRTRSDFMAMERPRSVRRPHVFDFGETGGARTTFLKALVEARHFDFRRYLPARQAWTAAVMVIDGAKGVEARRKAVSRSAARDLPILTFWYRWTRKRDVFEDQSRIQETSRLT